MAITPDFANKLILSDASITDIVAFHASLRDIEASDEGVLYPAVHSYKRLDLGGGAYFHACDFLNGWQLKFPAPGNYSIIGNIGAQIVPVAGVFIDRTKAAAFATVAGSGGGGGLTASDVWSYPGRTITQDIPSAADNAGAVWNHASAAQIISRLAEAWGRLGLDPTKPLITGDSQITFGDIVMAVVEAGGEVTLTRQ